jgi:hypothetical protein
VSVRCGSCQAVFRARFVPVCVCVSVCAMRVRVMPSGLGLSCHVCRAKVLRCGTFFPTRAARQGLRGSAIPFQPGPRDTQPRDTNKHPDRSRNDLQPLNKTPLGTNLAGPPRGIFLF